MRLFADQVMADAPTERRGHEYHQTTANGNARQHNGDEYHRYERVDAVYYGDVARTSTPISRGSILSPTRRITEARNGEALIDAASKGQIERMNRILSEKYTDIDFKDKRRKTTALLGAIEYGQAAAVTTLLKRGADPGLRYSERYKSPLLLAAEKGNTEIIAALLQYGAPTEGIQIGRGRKLGDIWWRNSYDSQTNSYVCKFAKDEYCRPTENGIIDAIAIAIIHSKPAIVIELLKHGVRPHKDALLAAIALDDEEVVRRLAAAGAEVERHPGLSYGSGYRPLHLAAGAGLQYSMQALIAAGACMDGDAEDRSPLHIAAAYGQTMSLQILLAAGAEIEAKDFTGCTALYLAAEDGGEESVQMLLAAGADMEARRLKYWTPLHVAAENGRSESIQMLLDAGAEIEPRDINKWTPLHTAAYWNRPEVTKVLLAAGANVLAVDDRGRTPYDLALAKRPYNDESEQNKRKVLALLKEHINKKHDDFDGRSFITARTRQHPDADDAATIRPDSDDDDDDEGAGDDVSEEERLAASVQHGLTILDT